MPCRLCRNALALTADMHFQCGGEVVTPGVFEDLPVFFLRDGNAFAVFNIGKRRPKIGIGVRYQFNESVFHGRLADMNAKSHSVLLFSQFGEAPGLASGGKSARPVEWAKLVTG